MILELNAKTLDLLMPACRAWGLNPKQVIRRLLTEHAKVDAKFYEPRSNN